MSGLWADKCRPVNNFRARAIICVLMRLNQTQSSIFTMRILLVPITVGSGFLQVTRHIFSAIPRSGYCIGYGLWETFTVTVNADAKFGVLDLLPLNGTDIPR